MKGEVTVDALLEHLEQKLRDSVLLLEVPRSMADAPLEVLVRAAHERGTRWERSELTRQAWLDYESALHRAGLPVERYRLHVRASAPPNHEPESRGSAPEPAPKSPAPPRASQGARAPDHRPAKPPPADDEDLLY